MSAFNHCHLNSSGWLLNACRQLSIDDWPIDEALSFDGYDHEENRRDETALSFFKAASSWGKAKKIVMKNLTMSLECQIAFESLLLSSAQLESLTLMKVSAIDGDLDAFSRYFCSSSIQIQELNIDCCRINREDATFLQRILDFGSLKHLSIRHVDLDDTISPLFLSLSAYSSVTSIHLSGCRMNHKSRTELMKALATCNGLESLTLQDCGIGSSDGEALNHLISTNLHLRILDLARNDICGPTLEYLAANCLRFNPTLQKLVLSHNPIGDDGASVLADWLISNRTLQSLSVIDCDIWRPGCVSLATGLSRMKGLRDLLIDGEMDELADIVIESLKSNMTLQHLWTDRMAYLIHKDRKWSNVEFLLCLNRGKRRILVEPSVPVSLWANLLEGVNSDPRLAYYIIRQKPDLISLGKRNDAVETNDYE